MAWFTGNEVPGVSYASYRTPYGVVVPTGGRVVAYVRSGGVQEQDPPEIKNKLVSTMQVALGRCRANYGDIVVVLNGHTENIAAVDSWSNLVAGTKIIGLGTTGDRPTFTWTIPTSSMLLDQANVSIDNCIFECAGPGTGAALTVAAPITISAAGVQLSRCRIHAEWDGNEDSQICITTTAAANGLIISDCEILGAPGNGANVTTLLRLVGADGFKMYNTIVDGYTNNANMGVIEFNTTESLGIYIDRCTIVKRDAASAVAVVGLANSTGVVRDTDMHVLDNAGIAIAARWTNPNNMMFARTGINETIASATGVGTPVSA